MEDLDTTILKIMMENPVFVSDLKKVIEKNNMRFEIQNGNTYFRMCSGVRYKREITADRYNISIEWIPELEDSIEFKELVKEN